MVLRANKGFTLVELSIVLVIIGLLIGGILAASSMISTSKIQAGVRQIGQFDAAVVTFQEKYSSMPGDSRFMAPTGDGDNVIEAAGTPDDISHFTNEVGNFWLHLVSSGFKKSGATFSSNAASGVVLDVNIPKFSVGRNAGVFAYTGYITADGVPGPTKHYYEIQDFSASTTTSIYGVYTYPFTAPEALAIDSKMDDGKGTTGFVRAIGYNYQPWPLNYIGIASLQTDNCLNDSDSTIYDTASSGLVCGLRIEMLSQVGGQ